MVNMTLLDDLLVGLPDGEVVEACIGLHWTAVVVNGPAGQRCGLASTLASEGYHHTSEPDVPQAGQLEALSGREMAALARSDRPTLRSLGFAAINALLPPLPDAWTDGNAEAIIAERGAGKTVAMVGHFPFVERLKPRVGTLYVLEQNPQGDDLPADAAPDILPEADVIAITAMTLVNGTLESLLPLCPSGATTLLLGPSTTLSPVLFDYGLDLISGAVVMAIEPVLRHIRQGANFRQVHRAGVRLVTMTAPDSHRRNPSSSAI